MTDDRRGYALPDPTRRVRLGDVGAPGWHAAVCVEPDGTDRLWLLTHGGRVNGCACPSCAPHEQGGAFRFPCVAVCKSGKRCHMKAPTPGGVCGTNRRHPPAQTWQPPPLLDDRARHG